MQEFFGHDTADTQIMAKRKLVNINDIRLLAGKENVESFLHPPEETMVRGIKVKIRDLAQGDEEELKRMSSIHFTESEVA